jgi:dipeptidyl-peptidase-4
VPPREPPSWLTLDAVAHYPRPGTVVPGNIAFSPDSRLVTYLFSERGDLVRELWTMDLATGERSILARAPAEGTTDANVNPEEALRRERQRLREGGITHYTWAKEADRILVPVNGQLYVTSSQGGPLQPVAPAASPAVDAQLASDGRSVVFVRDREIWVAGDAGDVRRLTFDATETVSNGLAEFIAQEEMGRSSGFWISPDSRHVAFEQFDDGHIAPYPIVHQGEAEWRVEEHRYPFAGGENVRVRLGVLDLADGGLGWLDLGSDPDIYLARVDWSPDGRLYAQIERRNQRRLELWRYDITSGGRELVLVEESAVWINLHNDLRFVGETGGEIVWSSERTGYRHLELRTAEGEVIRPLTGGKWPVDRLVDVDEERRLAYFVAGRETPVERHLYRVSLDGGEPERLSAEPGFDSAAFSPDHRRYVLTSESRSRPPSLVVRSAEGSPDVALHAAAREAAADLSVPDIVELRARDGEILYGAVYRPAHGGPPWPLIVSVYGGPHAQMVSDTWGMTVDLRAQYLAQRGFLVFKLDNRGSARRGLHFEGAIQRRLGSLEVQDQVDGVRWLMDRRLIDGGRVGIYGWSYGGYMAIMCLLTAPDVFKVAVAGAPVVDWDGYDTHYTERYMDTPAANAAGYRAASALTHVQRLAGKLLLVHGMVDENVHFRHTARLATALQHAGLAFELLVYPEERHMPRGEEGRRHMEAHIADYFTRHLQG